MMSSFSPEQISQLAASLPSFYSSTLQLQTKQIIYFVGITGSGKSLLINHMLGNSLQQQKIRGIGQIILAQSQNKQDAPKIGTHLNTSCTLTPSLYPVKQYDNLMFCDTPGYQDQGMYKKTCQMLNELYLGKAESIAAIVFVININDLRSQKGGGFSAVFEELNRILNFNEIKKKILFIINYKNVYEDQIEDLFQQLSAYQKQIQDKLGNNEMWRKLDHKSKFFEAIFDKEVYNQQTSLEKFKNKVIIATKEKILSEKCELRRDFFSKVMKIRSKQKLHLKESISKKMLISQLTASILGAQSVFDKAFIKYQRFSKSKLIEFNFWNLLKLNGQNVSLKANRLNHILLSNDIDMQQTRRLIYTIEAQISEFQLLKQKLFVAYSVEVDEMKLHKTNQFPVTINLQFEVKNIIKQIEGFIITKQTFDLEKGKYQAHLKSIQSQSNKVVKFLVLASYEDRDKAMIAHLCNQRDKFKQKLQSKYILEALPFQQQLSIMLQIVKKTRDQKYFVDFVQKYSIQNTDMFDYLPKRGSIETYLNSLTIYQALMNVNINNECINTTYFDRLKQVPFLKLDEEKDVEKNRGYCSLNYHKICELLRLECGHEYEESCFNVWFKGELKVETYECTVCKKKGRVVEVEEHEKEKCRKEFDDFFKLEGKEDMENERTRTESKEWEQTKR